MTSTWQVVHRTDDGERVGYVTPATGDGRLVVPMTLAGTPAAGPLPVDAATALLTGTGLAVLARRWWCRLPDPLPAGVTDAGRPDEDWAWRPTVPVEVFPTEVRVRPEHPAPEERSALAVLPFPAADLLRPTAPT
ncbi:hypothetical protein [Modestobacter altitudinis]|uniref:hypothetical protein n=1 Tax=Modestobacter altitudinis TaxID=2213158 RepID=UPI00110D0DF8|nr:hypothetical protein [Modestobacter altitudinis]